MRDGKESIVPPISVGTIRVVIVTILLALLLGHGVALPNAEAPIIRTVDIGHGITLHYVEVGKGTPVIFVHGSLSDGGYCLRSISRTLVRVPWPAPASHLRHNRNRCRASASKG